MGEIAAVSGAIGRGKASRFAAVVEPYLAVCGPDLQDFEGLAWDLGLPWEVMAYVTKEARQELLETVAEATDEIGVALAALAAAYGQLDEYNADRLEDELFRPVQVAYGRAKRTHAAFADRHGLTSRTFEPASAGASSQGVRGFLDRAVEAVGEADRALAELQDSMMPVEVGDAELRAGLAEVRELVGGLRERARQLVRTLGR